MMIIATNNAGAHRTGDLSDKLSPKDIESVLGFSANIDDDGSKVKHSWGFTVDGSECGIWDYKGHCWSVYDPDNKLPELFANILAEKAA